MLLTLLIAVDKELHFTRYFILSAQSELQAAQRVYHPGTWLQHRALHHTRLTEGTTSSQIKETTDWQLAKEAQRQVL